MHPNHNTRRRLSEILGGDAANLQKTWAETEAAGDYKPLPSGQYIAHLHDVELATAKTGTPSAKLTFRVCEGVHAGRLLWLDCWLTPAALPQSKRDLAKLGITELAQLENANVPPNYVRCNVRVALRRDDGGIERNAVKGFDFVQLDELPKPDAFAPTAVTAAGATPPAPSVAAAAADETEGNGEAEEELFPFGHNAPDAQSWGRA